MAFRVMAGQDIDNNNKKIFHVYIDINKVSSVLLDYEKKWKSIRWGRKRR